MKASEFDKFNQKGLLMMSALRLKNEGIISEESYLELEAFCQLEYAIGRKKEVPKDSTEDKPDDSTD